MSKNVPAPKAVVMTKTVFAGVGRRDMPARRLFLAGHENAVVAAKAVCGDAGANMIHYCPGKRDGGSVADFARCHGWNVRCRFAAGADAVMATGATGGDPDMVHPDHLPA